jgi:predicted acylesterase/phospholipase RssA
MAAMVCVRTDDELDHCFTPDLVEHIRCCSATLGQRIENYKKTGALLDADFFREEARWFTKDMTFLEAYQRTGRILNISVMSTEVHSKFKVLNYINTPDVTIASAVVASSSVPGVLPPCELYIKKRMAIANAPYQTRSRTLSGSLSSSPTQKYPPTRSPSPTDTEIKLDFTDSSLQWREKVYDHAGQTWRDGSMKSDIPHQELYQLFRVKHTIVSQVNPHIALFFFNPLGSAGRPSRHRQGRGWRGGFVLAFLVQYFLLDLLKWIQLLRNMYLLPDILGADFSHLWLQTFEGHCTITPSKPVTFMQLTRLLVDPDRDRLKNFIEEGQRCTWPKIKMIRNRVVMEQRIGYWLRNLKNGLARAA